MTGPSVVRGLLLDIDDTLIDTRAAFRAAVRTVLATRIPELDQQARDAAALRWALDPGGHFRAYTRGERSYSEQLRARVEDLHLAFDGPVLDEPGYLSWIEDYVRVFRGSWRVHPDAVHLLDLLRDRRVPFGAVTNMAGDAQRDKLAVVGLSDVRLLVAVDDLGRGKPDPAVFRLGCERLGLPPAQVAYVGDELDVDARGARDAGLVGVWLDRHGTGHRPDDVPSVADLTQLPSVLTLQGRRRLPSS